MFTNNMRIDELYISDKFCDQVTRQSCDCEEILSLISQGKINTLPLITHTYPLSKIDEAYRLFENKEEGVIKIAVEC